MQTMRKSTGTESCSAFTLVELMVVIAIIAILVTLILPAIKSGVAQARASQCANNQRQVGVAMPLFAAEHEGRLPWAQAPTGYPNNQYISWDDQLSGYDGRERLSDTQMRATFLRGGSKSKVKDANKYKCPAETRFDSHVKAGDILMRSYTMPRSGPLDKAGRPAGVHLANNGGSQPTWSPQFSQIPNLAETIMLAEVRGDQTRLGSVNGVIVDRPLPINDSSAQVQKGMHLPLHNPYWNYLFCDGHVEKLLPHATLNPKWQWHTYRWTRDPND